MASVFHTVTLPVGRGASRALAWEPQDPASIRTCALDCTAWCADAGTTIVAPFVQIDPSMIGGAVTCDGAVVQITLTGGTPGTAPVTAFALLLANGNREDVSVSVQILAPSLGIPAGAIAIGSQPLTLARMPIDVAQMTALPGGPLAGDSAIVYRAGVAVGLQSVASLGGAAASGYSQMPAGAAVSGHRALMFDGLGGVIHADPTLSSYAFAGVSTQAAPAATMLFVAEGGVVTEPTWAWTPGGALYTGPGGALTQTPPASGILQQIGVAVSAMSMLVQPFPAIIRN